MTILNWYYKNILSSLLPPVASRLWNFFSVLEHRPSCPPSRWESPSPSWWSPRSLTWLSCPCPFLPTLKEAILTFPYIFITRSTRCPLAPPPRKVATVPCPLLPAMDRGKFFLCYFSKTEICIFMENHFRKALHKLVTHPTTLTSQNSGREVIILKLDYLGHFDAWWLIILKLFYLGIFLIFSSSQVLSLEEILAEGVPAQVTADHNDEDYQIDHCDHQLALMSI